MCGISGAFTRSAKKHPKRQLQKLTQLLINSQVSRGPDDMSCLSVGTKISLGHNRLSILDLDERSNQPMSFKEWTITYNGEIYNFKDIKKSLIKNHNATFNTTGDSEVILKGIYYLGFEGLIKELNGIFALGAYNKKSRTLWLARDRIGIKPLYYYQDESLFLFASTPAALAKALHKERGVVFDINYSALYECFSLGCAYGEDSLFTGIKKLLPAQIMSVDRSLKIDLQKYWELKKIKTSPEEIKFLLKDSIKKRLLSDVPMALLFSGGTDSTLVSSFMDINCFHVDGGLPNQTLIGIDNSRTWSDAQYAKEAAVLLERDLYVLKLENFCPRCDPAGFEKSAQQMDDLIRKYISTSGDLSRSSLLPTLASGVLQKKGYKVGVSGNGGDELFFGYQRTVREMEGGNGRADFSKRDIRNLHKQIFRIFRDPRTFRIKGHPPQTQSKFAEDLITQFKFKSKQLNKIAFSRKLELETMIADLNTTLDFAGMSSGVELRVPLLDYRLVQASLNLPFSKVGNKRIMKNILTEKGFSRRFVDRQKLGFSASSLTQYYSQLGKSSLNKLKNEYKIITVKTPTMRDSTYINNSARMLDLWIEEWVETGIVRL